MEADATRYRATTEQQENRFTIPLIAHVFTFSLILLSWLPFNWLDNGTVSALLLPLLAVLNLLGGLLTLLLKWLGYRPLRIETNRQGLFRYVTFVAILIAAAPVYAYFHGIWITSSFVSEFDLDVRVESREFVLLEPAHRMDKPTSVRGITTVFTVLGPKDETKSKLRNRLRDERSWLLSRTGYFWGSCDRKRLGRYMTVILAGEDTLHVAIQYGVPSYCLLNRPEWMSDFIRRRHDALLEGKIQWESGARES